MINDSQHVTRTGPDERVIQRGADIHQRQRAAEDRATGDLPGGPMRCSDHQDDRPAESKDRPHAMRGGVRDDVGRPVFRHYRSASFGAGERRIIPSLMVSLAKTLYAHRISDLGHSCAPTAQV